MSILSQDLTKLSQYLAWFYLPIAYSLLFCAYCLVYSSCIAAQELSHDRFQQIPNQKSTIVEEGTNRMLSLNIRGLENKEIVERFGVPDEKRSSSQDKEQNTETWVYGNSLIMFRNEKVIAWSDLGDLTGRENLAKIQENSADSNSQKNVGSASEPREPWKNPWTPSFKSTTSEDITKELQGLIPDPASEN